MASTQGSIAEGLGATITFADSAFTMRLVDIDGLGFDFDPIETTYLGQIATDGIYARTYICSQLYEGGQLNCTAQYDPDKFGSLGLNSANQPSNNSDRHETVTITLPNKTNPITFEGFILNFRFSCMVGALMQGQLTVKVAGQISGLDTA